MVVADIEDVFVPMERNFFVDPQESRFLSLLFNLNSRLQIEDLLTRIETMFKDSQAPEPSLGAAVFAAVTALVHQSIAAILILRKNSAGKFQLC